MNEEFLTVSALTKYIKLKFDKDRYLVDVPLRAEIAEIHRRRGNYYLRLKDEAALISGVIFAEYETDIVQQLETGMDIVVTGDVSVYEKTGVYQIYIHEVELFGQGHLAALFERLKQKLFARGYFNTEHKKTIPAMPQKVVLVTAPGSAALHDMLVTLQKRYPLVELTVLPTAVQGAKAVPNLIKQLKKADKLAADVIVLARGGGSYEDLQAFNDEQLAVTIFELQTPLVTGIGHEIDVTIADLVADLRTATPSAAIEHITPDKVTLYALLETLQYRMEQDFHRRLQQAKNIVFEQSQRLFAKSPAMVVKNQRSMLHHITEQLCAPYRSWKIFEQRRELLLHKQQQLQTILANKLMLAQEELKHKQTHLEALSPFDVLLRGYSITQKAGNVISSTKQVFVKDTVEVFLADGTLVCNVEEIKNDKEKTII